MASTGVPGVVGGGRFGGGEGGGEGVKGGREWRHDVHTSSASKKGFAILSLLSFNKSLLQVRGQNDQGRSRLIGAKCNHRMDERDIYSMGVENTLPNRCMISGGFPSET